uniref:Ketoacyl_synth_N domain-containing protein n=1 Tax=Syphacia muris TaxID=451379 RepID=A0A0N5AI08_9BILA
MDIARFVICGAINDATNIQQVWQCVLEERAYGKRRVVPDQVEIDGYSEFKVTIGRLREVLVLLAYVCVIEGGKVDETANKRLFLEGERKERWIGGSSSSSGGGSSGGIQLILDVIDVMKKTVDEESFVVVL